MAEMFSSLKISGSGLSVFRRKMNVAAENMANVETTRTKDGGPYKKKKLQIVGKSVPANFSRTLQSAATRLTRTQKSHMPARGVSRFRGNNVFHAEGEVKIDPQQGVRMEYDPSHPDADADGFVAMPDIDPLTEMVEMMTAARAYEANITAIQAAKEIASKSMDI